MQCAHPKHVQLHTVGGFVTVHVYMHTHTICFHVLGSLLRNVSIEFIQIMSKCKDNLEGLEFFRDNAISVNITVLPKSFTFRKLTASLIFNLEAQ